MLFKFIRKYFNNEKFIKENLIIFEKGKKGNLAESLFCHRVCQDRAVANH